MRAITISVPHNLTAEDAKRRIEAGIAKLQQEHGTKFDQLARNWQGDTMSFSLQIMGMSAAGEVRVESQTVWITVNLPWVIAMFADTLKAGIEQETRKALELK